MCRPGPLIHIYYPFRRLCPGGEARAVAGWRFVAARADMTGPGRNWARALCAAGWLALAAAANCAAGNVTGPAYSLIVRIPAERAGSSGGVLSAEDLNDHQEPLRP
jgi:hypothetical protein